MKIIKQTFLEIDRRDFLQLAGVSGAAALMSSFARGEVCVPVEGIKVTANTVTIQDQSKADLGLEYWIDGLHLADGPMGSDVISRATLAVFNSKFQQSPTDYVELVELRDSADRVLAQRFLRPQQSNSKGQAPYVIFEDLKLNYRETYLIYYHIRKTDKIQIYRFEGVNAKRSSLASTQVRLPYSIKKDIKETGGTNQPSTDPVVANEQKDYWGMVTTPYIHYTEAGLGLHSARSQISKIEPNGSFEISIEMMHGDQTDGHYMRYFIVADPVGRLLGYVKRNFGDPAPAVDGVKVTPLSSDTAKTSVVTTEMNQQGYKWSAGDIANINDCPYIQIFTEDRFDALARQVVRLR